MFKSEFHLLQIRKRTFCFISRELIHLITCLWSLLGTFAHRLCMDGGSTLHKRGFIYILGGKWRIPYFPVNLKRRSRLWVSLYMWSSIYKKKSLSSIFLFFLCKKNTSVLQVHLWEGFQTRLANQRRVRRNNVVFLQNVNKPRWRQRGALSYWNRKILPRFNADIICLLLLYIDWARLKLFSLLF